MSKKLDDLASAISKNTSYRIQGGETGCLIYRAQYQGNDVVIKIANPSTPASINEIDSNLQSYDSLDKKGLSNLNPQIYFKGEEEGSPFIVMEDLGETVDKRILSGELDYGGVTKILIENLDNLYETGLRKDPKKSTRWVESIVKNIQKYVDRNVELGIINKNCFNLLEDSSVVNKLSTQNVTFATGDLTPDNVFIKDGSLKMIDYKGVLPENDVEGINIVDLMMWGYVSKDSYEYPGSQKIFKESIRPFVEKWTERISPNSDPMLVKLLGIARQNSLSTYFGYKKGRKNWKITAKNLVEALGDIEVLLK